MPTAEPAIDLSQSFSASSGLRFSVSIVSVVEPGAIASEWSGISADNLEKTSKGTASGTLVTPMTNILRHESAGKPAPPEVVARAVSHAVNSRSPARRYAVPFQSKMMIALVQWLQYKKNPISYLSGEKAYIILSLVAKSALAWQIFSGTLIPAN